MCFGILLSTLFGKPKMCRATKTHEFNLPMVVRFAKSSSQHYQAPLKLDTIIIR